MKNLEYRVNCVGIELGVIAKIMSKVGRQIHRDVRDMNFDVDRSAGLLWALFPRSEK